MNSNFVQFREYAYNVNIHKINQRSIEVYTNRIFGIPIIPSLITLSINIRSINANSIIINSSHFHMIIIPHP